MDSPQQTVMGTPEVTGSQLSPGRDTHSFTHVVCPAGQARVCRGGHLEGLFFIHTVHRTGPKREAPTPRLRLKESVHGFQATVGKALSRGLADSSEGTERGRKEEEGKRKEGGEEEEREEHRGRRREERKEEKGVVQLMGSQATVLAGRLWV